MRKMTLRFCGALGGLLAPLLLTSCEDGNQVCEPVTGEDGTTQQLCYEIGDFGTSTLAQETDEPAGDNCPEGGRRIDTGFDDNDNGTLDANEVDISAYICNGEQGPTGPTGASGATGANALSAMYPEDPGVACENGGMRINFGVDVNNDGTLQAEEVEGTRYVCHGVTGFAAPWDRAAPLRHRSLR